MVILFLTNARELFISLHSQNHGRMEQRKTGRLQAPHAAQGFCKARRCLTIGMRSSSWPCSASLSRSQELRGRDPGRPEWLIVGSTPRPECAQPPGNLFLLYSLLSWFEIIFIGTCSEPSMLRTLGLISAPHKLDKVSQAYNLSAQGSRDRRFLISKSSSCT